ncbi:RNA 2',3'-cyclic phosphodiesterase [Rossellomorea vietnamensis]|uniref:RNA 2',3'-cyclic phosphodiesterase n=1 Tax=Rossellomorea vietnamensis TaxID=218284 RepID=A0A5D4M8J3_9BACI|nr:MULTISPECIES: RNA 2',3'-cyclic phosphodiesterase [Bacillaceae]TYR98254.1 RNA 2',3'-cyclic phosphodiesterase [Rossellomorea vietnamensis]
MMKQHHYFFAVPIPQETKETMEEWSGKVKGALPFQRWVHPQDYHITLAFLGGTEEERLRKTIERVHALKGEFHIFSLAVQQLGTFGKPSSPRILWSDVSPSSSLSSLRDAVYSACLQEGYELDQRPFNPHITIARKWAGDEEFPGSKLASLSLEEPLEFKVEEFVLYRTHLDRTPKYETVEKFTLI